MGVDVAASCSLAASISTLARISSVGSTQSIGIELQRSEGQLTRSAPLFLRTARHLDLLASNNLPANQTVTFVVQRMPLPKLIELAQNIEFLSIRKANRGG